MELNVKTAEKELERAEKLNPGDWVAHSRFVALACRNIAACCPGLSPDEAYCFGLLHDIGRYAGRSSEKHLIDVWISWIINAWEMQICAAFSQPRSIQ